MRLRETTLRPLFRSVAAATLFGWQAAQVLCTAHCSLGVGDCETGDAHCHGPLASASHHDDGDSPKPAHDDTSTSAACITLKTALVNAGSLTLIQPDLFLLYTPPPFALALDVSAIEPEASFSRQAQPRDWVFTPEVCLGPAFRSQAPPIRA